MEKEYGDGECKVCGLHSTRVVRSFLVLGNGGFVLDVPEYYGSVSVN